MGSEHRPRHGHRCRSVQGLTRSTGNHPCIATRQPSADSLPLVSNDPDSPSVPASDPDSGTEQLDQLETDLDTVESSLAALDSDNLDQAETLAGSLAEGDPISEGRSDET